VIGTQINIVTVYVSQTESPGIANDGSRLKDAYRDFQSVLASTRF
jgi:hypothetical protein